MKRIVFLGLVLVGGLLTGPVSADPILVSGALTSKPDGQDFDYTITLVNSAASTDKIGTFWFAWLPGEDFLPTSPLSTTSPSNWGVQTTHAGPNDGFALQWVANSSAFDLAPGGSLQFGFKSADTPAKIAGNSPFFSGTPVGTSTVYQGGPFLGDSAVFVVSATSVPEPSVVTLSVVTAIASFAILRYRSRSRRSRSSAGHGVSIRVSG